MPIKCCKSMVCAFPMNKHFTMETVCKSSCTETYQGLRAVKQEKRCAAAESISHTCIFLSLIYNELTKPMSQLVACLCVTTDDPTTCLQRGSYNRIESFRGCSHTPGSRRPDPCVLYNSLPLGEFLVVLCFFFLCLASRGRDMTYRPAACKPRDERH